MRNRILVCLAAIGALVGLATPAQAQPQTTTMPSYEIGLGYQFLRVGEFCAGFDASDCDDTDPQNFPFGILADISRNFGPLGIVGEVGWNRRQEDYGDDDPFGDRANIDLLTGAAGLRFTGRWARVWGYGQILGGGTAISLSGNIGNDDFEDTRLRPLAQAGGGLTFVIGDGWGLFIQGDYRRLFLDEDEDFSSGSNDVRGVFGFRLILD